ncbi:MAG: hypothetical protein ABSG44_12305 [Thermodesulfobacteriota bacterium]
MKINPNFNLWDGDVNPTSFLIGRMVYGGIKRGDRNVPLLFDKEMAKEKTSRMRIEFRINLFPAYRF